MHDGSDLRMTGGTSNWFPVTARLMMFIGGLACLLAGAFLVGEYVWHAVIERWGLPDQSLMFWLSIFPMLGIPLIAVGVMLFYRFTRSRS